MTLEPRQERALRLTTLGVCLASTLALGLPWSANLNTLSGRISEQSALSWDTFSWPFVALLVVGAIQLFCLGRPHDARWDPRLLLSGALVALGIPITIDWGRSWAGLVEPRWGFWTFASLWLLLLALHLWWLPGHLRWLATGPRRDLERELLSALALGLVPAALLIALAALLAARVEGAFAGRSLLLVPVPVAIALSAWAVGFVLALWLRLRRAEPEAP